MSRTCLTVWLGVALLAALWGCSDRGRPREAQRPLVIGTDATYPPLEFRDGDRLTGFDVELGKAIARELGRDVQWVNCGFDGIFAALQGGKFDLVLSAVTITDERRKSLAFSDPYYTAGQALAARKAGKAYSGPEELGGLTVGIQINTTAKEVLKRYPDVHVREYNSIDLALLDLQNGGLEAVMTDSPVLKYMLNRGYDELTLSGKLLTEEHYGVVARQDDVRLLAQVNAALSRLESSGELIRVKARWFGDTEVPPARRSRRELLAVVMPALARAALVTIGLTVASLLAGLPLGLGLALMRLSHRRWLGALAAAYIEVFRGTPLLVQLFAVYYVLPSLGVQLAQWPAAMLAFTLNSSAYVAEIFRSGIRSLDAGQMEAARSLGMTYGLAMRLVILPQAIRRVLPPLTNEAIALLKDTSLVSVIAMVELTREGQQLTGSLAAPMLIWPLVGAFYLALTLPLTRLAHYLEKRWKT